VSKTLEAIKARRVKVLSGWIVPEPNKALPAHHRYCTVEFTANEKFGIQVVPFTNGDVPIAEFIANAASDIDFLLEQLALGRQQIVTMLTAEADEYKARGKYDLEEHWRLLIERVKEL